MNIVRHFASNPGPLGPPPLSSPPLRPPLNIAKCETKHRKAVSLIRDRISSCVTGNRGRRLLWGSQENYWEVFRELIPEFERK
ncbi:hypothetical protein CEXT_189261 [Caerostris extrusa]|uniref:Uncharacterized protein n=1 Tax=Caerostris extrusa TaxID=172846 RepID=A0AAV4MK48_CAEEX|nr:hypothetical protein CEXT_189261 [Caerostris extrusa]